MKFSSHLDRTIERLKRCELLRETEVRELCNQASLILAVEENVLCLSSPITICGDVCIRARPLHISCQIHAQFSDLLELFRVGGDVGETCYLFMGDYVDRGNSSIETFLLLIALKVRYLDRIWLLRGNHECRQITQVYGFYDECIKKYGSSNVWRYCCQVFDVLAVAAVIDGEAFVVHGGLSPGLDLIDDIRTKIDRRQEVPHEGALCDLLWGDPDDSISGFAVSPRGAGFLFGADIVRRFAHLNGVDYIARAHQLVMEGYKWMFDETLLTVWSSPNYCYRCGNVAAIVLIDGPVKDVKVFDSALVEQTSTPSNNVEYFI
jgi:serine/threonine-protein phosphatase 4 catalytic subunit